jgi:predicted MPP superfamily phosphohydrolase
MTYGDFAKVKDQYDDTIFNIMLVHDPAGWAVAEKFGTLPDLTLSGHTHGMQIGLPVPGGYISPASAIHEYWKGLYSKDDSFLFVTAGLGTMGMAARIFMPPEIIVLTLRQE